MEQDRGWWGEVGTQRGYWCFEKNERKKLKSGCNGIKVFLFLSYTFPLFQQNNLGTQIY